MQTQGGDLVAASEAYEEQHELARYRRLAARVMDIESEVDTLRSFNPKLWGTSVSIKVTNELRAVRLALKTFDDAYDLTELEKALAELRGEAFSMPAEKYLVIRVLASRKGPISQFVFDADFVDGTKEMEEMINRLKANHFQIFINETSPEIQPGHTYVLRQITDNGHDWWFHLVSEVKESKDAREG